MTHHPVLVACCRTAIGRSHASRGCFRHIRGDELAARVLGETVRRSGVDPTLIDDVLFGATKQHGELGGNVARNAAILAGLPFTAAASTVNRLCGSGLEAIMRACQAVRCGEADVQLAGGVEHMHHLPMESQLEIHPRVFARSSRGALSMGLTAEHLAATHGISRAEQEQYALDSHRKASAAAEAGGFDDEIVPVLGHDEQDGLYSVVRDQAIRSETSLEAMAALEPAFVPKFGTITAATSSPLSDGAAAMTVMAEATAVALGIQPLARVLGAAAVGVSPAVMGTGPVAATEKLLTRTGIAREDIDLVEINEAFAAQAIHNIRTLRLDPERVNVHGGSLAIGHPLGATGARLVTTLVHALRRRQGGLGLATMCVGLGQGVAILLEVASGSQR
ncbi:MAG: thiolase family protein [Pirellulales bacterium]|jgi:acetyl-CoA acyltransferase